MKLRLKKWDMADIPTIMNIINNVHVWSTLTNTAVLPLTKDRTASYIKQCSDESGEIDSFAIVLDDEIVGGVSLCKMKPPYHIVFELDFWLDPVYWGKGVMTEVLYDIIQHGFMHLPALKIIAKVFGNDKKSINLLKKVGFREVAVFKNTALKCGEMRDLVIFEKTEIGN